MSQVARNEDVQRGGRVYVGALVDREARRELSELAAKRDRPVASVLRQAIAAELERAREMSTD